MAVTSAFFTSTMIHEGYHIINSSKVHSLALWSANGSNFASVCIEDRHEIMPDDVEESNARKIDIISFIILDILFFLIIIKYRNNK